MAIAPSCFALDPDTPGTLQQRIRQMVAEAILAGRLQPGERMPSSRGLASYLGVSRITVTLAYGDLVADDFLQARGRSGYFVSAQAVPPPVRAAPRVQDGAGVDWARALGPRAEAPLGSAKPADWRSYRFPFIYGQADPALFDHQSWRACTLRALGQRDFPAMSDDSFEADDPRLVEYIARHSLPRRGILARPEEVLVTLGAQNALWLAAQLLLNQRRVAGIEDPGYPGLRAILGQTRCRVQPLAVGPQGLEPDRLPRGLDVLFCTPSHHCPTGATMPLNTRRALLRRAEAEGLLVVEDDYEFELATGGAALPALKALDRSDRVIHVGSFSKSLFPGLRLGYLVGAAPFIREARALRASVLRHPPGLIQRAAAYFLSLGHHDAMLRRLGAAFHQRRQITLDAVAREGLHLASSTRAPGGSSLWMRAPDGLDTAALAARLRGQGVLIEPGAPFFHRPQAPTGFYRIAYSSIPADRIPEGIARIARIARAMEAPHG